MKVWKARAERYKEVFRYIEEVLEEAEKGRLTEKGALAVIRRSVESALYGATS